jgi:hypothetical protein
VSKGVVKTVDASRRETVTVHRETGDSRTVTSAFFVSSYKIAIVRGRVLDWSPRLAIVVLSIGEIFVAMETEMLEAWPLSN